MSLLTLAQAAARQLNVAVPASIVGNDDETAVLLLRLASEEGESLMRRYPWQALIREGIITTLAQESQGALPSDFDRMMPETMYNRTRRRYVSGPLSPEDWAQQKALLQVYVNPTYRLRGNEILLANTPQAGETIAYEYVSRNWCQSSGGTAQADWLADTDTGRIDEKLMTLGLVWRFRQVKGLSYGEDMAQYERRVTEAMMRDGQKPRLSLDPDPVDRVPRAPQVPETLIFP